jgi:hypothetical protein
MALIFTILMLVLLAAFLGLGYGYDFKALDSAPPLISTLTQIGISTTQVQILLGVGILFCQFGIIIVSMLDRIGDTVKAIIKPLIRLVPLSAFLTAIWQTYSPVMFSLLPSGVAQAFGAAKVDSYMAQAVSDGSFSSGVLWTLVTMLLFVITTRVLGQSADSDRVRDLRAQVRSLMAENSRLKRDLYG